MADPAKCPNLHVNVPIATVCPDCNHPCTVHRTSDLVCSICHIAGDPEVLKEIAFQVLKLLAGGGADTASS